MDLNARYTALAAELGHLDSEIRERKSRRKAIRSEMKVLKRLVVLIQQEAAHAATAVPAGIHAVPDRAATNVPDAG